MLPILQNQSVLTMTSREIAELTGKNHFDVKRDIQNVLLQANIDASKFAVIYLDSQNRNQSEYRLPKRECDLVVSGYSVKYRLAIIDRWHELEAKQPTHILPQTFAEALRLAADQQETIQAQAAQIEAQKPAVEFVDKYVQSTGNMGFRQVAKLLSIKESDFRAFLQDNSIMYRLGGEWVAYAQHISAGRFVTKTGTNQQNGHAYNGALFTPKGVQWIAGLLETV
jgi:phage antirepressor YoqD-like protein